MDEEFETLDQAMEYLKLKKPHEYGLDIPGISSPTALKTMKTKKATQIMRQETSNRSNSLNYVSVIKSGLHHDLETDSLLDEGLASQITDEQIRNFAIMLMRERLSIENGFNRSDTFNTSLGMAFSALNDSDEKPEEGSQSEGSDKDDSDDEKNKKAHHHHEHPLETERHIKKQEAQFLKTIQGNFIEEFDITGTAEPPKVVEESLYLV